MKAAENLKITAENLNSMLTTSLKKISDTRKRTKKLKAVSILRKRRKKKEIKIEIPSEFKKATKRIGKILPSGMGQNMMTSIVELISLLLVGVAVNNIDELKERLDKLKVGLDKSVKFIRGIVESVYNGTRGFIALFDSEDREKQFKEVNDKKNELEKLDNEVIEINKLSDKLKKDYENVQKNFNTNKEKILNEIKLNEKGSLSTGETYEIIEENGVKKIKINKENGKEEIVKLDKFLKENKSEIPNIVYSQDNNLMMDKDSFKIDKNDLIKNLDLSMLDEEEIENLTYVVVETD